MRSFIEDSESHSKESLRKLIHSFDIEMILHSKWTIFTLKYEGFYVLKKGEEANHQNGSGRPSYSPRGRSSMAKMIAIELEKDG